MKVEIQGICRATGSSIRLVRSCWRTSSLTRVESATSVIWAWSVNGTMPGPIAHERSRFLPCVTLSFAGRTRSRMVTSVHRVRAAIWLSACASGMRRLRLPMNTAQQASAAARNAFGRCRFGFCCAPSAQANREIEEGMVRVANGNHVMLRLLGADTDPCKRQNAGCGRRTL